MKISSPLLLILLCWVVSYAQEPVLKSKTTVVNLEFTVTDQAGKYLTNFGRDDFVLYENKVRQNISHFVLMDEPISYSFVIDQSGSMGKDFPTLKKAVESFVQYAHRDDTYNLVFFNSKPTVVVQSVNGSSFLNQFLYLKPEKQTAVWDAVSTGIDALRTSPCKRKVLVLFSDGMDNYSRFGASSICRNLKELDIRVEVFSFPGQYYFPPSSRTILGQASDEALFYREVIAPKEAMQEMASLTGGRVVLVSPQTDLDWEAAQLAVELRRSFSLGYISSSEPDGKWRKLSLSLPGCPTCRIQVRSGYYAK